MLHGIADYSCGRRGVNSRVETVDGPLHDDMARIVGHREVPPVEGRTADARVDELEGLGRQVAAHEIAGPENVDALVECAAEICQRAAFGRVCPKARIVGGAHYQAADIPFPGHEFTRQSVKQLRLALGIGSGSLDVVEEEGEVAHSEVIHHRELGDETVVVGLIPPDVAPRMDSPDKTHMVAAGSVDELAEFGGLSLGIGLAPVR